MSDPESFGAQNDVIVVSRDEVESPEWFSYICRNGEHLTSRKNARILVLAGVHGASDGGMGEPDEELFQEAEGQVGRS